MNKQGITIQNLISGFLPEKILLATEVFYEDCSDITDWVITAGGSSGWESYKSECRAINTDGETTMTSEAIDLSAGDIAYAELTFDYETAGLDGGEYCRAYVNSTGTGAFQLIFDLTAIASSGTATLNISENITLDSSVFLRLKNL